MPATEDSVRRLIQSQFDISWQLLTYHLEGLTDEECLWKPRPQGLFVEPCDDGWHADWPESEGYDIGPPNIAWLTWHIIFWWSMAINHSFGNGTLAMEDIRWPGSAELAKAGIYRLRDEWVQHIATVPTEELLADKQTKWPFENKPFYELAGWLTVELMKNAAEIGYCRFLYAARDK